MSENQDFYTIAVEDTAVYVLEDKLIIVVDRLMPETYPGTEGIDHNLIELVRLANVGVRAEQGTI